MGEESVITSERRFRRATMADLPTMLKIYEHARKLMASNGNPTQWGDKFPREEVVRDDVESQRTVLLVDTVDGEERVLAQFALCPGIDPTYVRLCPRISASSFMPPSDMRENFRPMARAMDFPSDVLPTPGGPTKQSIGPFMSALSFMTLKNSRMRSFTLSRS